MSITQAAQLMDEVDRLKARLAAVERENNANYTAFRTEYKYRNAERDAAQAEVQTLRADLSSLVATDQDRRAEIAIEFETTLGAQLREAQADLTTAHRMLTAIAVELGVSGSVDLAASVAVMRNARREAEAEVREMAALVLDDNQRLQAANIAVIEAQAEVARLTEEDRIKTDADDACAQAAEADIARLRAVLTQIKPLVTGQLPTPLPWAMMSRCMTIADWIDAALDAGPEA